MNRLVNADDEINILDLTRANGDRYIFRYLDKNRSKVLQIFGRYASDQGLSFTWYDAAVLSQKIRESVK